MLKLIQVKCMIVQTDDDEMMMKVTVAVVCLLHHMTTHGLIYLRFSQTHLQVIPVDGFL